MQDRPETIPTLETLPTPAAVVDLDRLDANLARVAAYARQHGFALRPHAKTHKTRELATAQMRAGARGLTVATSREAEVMAGAAADLLVAYPPVGEDRLRRMLDLPSETRLTVALDSQESLADLARNAAAAQRRVGVLVELDMGMGRCGVTSPQQTVDLARTAADQTFLDFRGVMFYPGHIREPVIRQATALARLAEDLGRHLVALDRASLAPEVVSGGSTPTLFQSHTVPGQTEIRPGTYVFNDRTTAAIQACEWDHIAYSVLATVVSLSAASDRAVVDTGSKALAREELRGQDVDGYGALLDRPEIAVTAVSEEHGVLDLSPGAWRPRVGDRVRIVPNHVCVSVNLQEHLWVVRGDAVVEAWAVAARGRAPVHAATSTPLSVTS